MKAHRRLRFALAETAEEPLVAELWGAGTTGVEVRPTTAGRLEVDAFFLACHRLPPAALESGSGYWGVEDCDLVAVGRVEAADWLAHYREIAVPELVGGRLIVDPREPSSDPSLLDRTSETTRRLLRLPARTAFGTGSHESTRLAVRLLESQDIGGLRVLDVGSGSGILAFAALVAGARSVVAVEIDLAAALIASQNQGLNEMFFGLAAGGLGCLRRGAGFDLGLVNVVPEAIRPELPAIAGLIREGGRAVFSGFLAEQAQEVVERLRSHGFETIADLEDGEWKAVLVELGGSR